MKHGLELAELPLETSMPFAECDRTELASTGSFKGLQKSVNPIKV
jgi:hypothetical protein